MPNQFEKFGLREIANVGVYALDDDARMNVKKNDLVLFFDTLKTSNFEFTADKVDAKGGRGAPKLVTWNSAKEGTVTLQDALLSAASMALLAAAQVKEASATNVVYITKIENLTADSAGKITLQYAPAVVPNMPVAVINNLEATSVEDMRLQVTTATDNTITDLTLANKRVVVSYQVAADGTSGKATTITIDTEHFPGTYRVVGETLIRSQKTGKDYPYQFVINKCALSNEFSFSMEAEGDPSVFDVSLDILRDEDKNMVEFILYELEDYTPPTP